MERLKIFDDGQEKKITYTDRIAKGIFLVADSKTAKDNCKLFNINMGERDGLEQAMKVSKIDKAAIVSTRVDNEYVQYILLNYVEQSDFQDFLNDVPSHVKQALTTAYNLNKVNTLEDLDLLKSIGNAN